MSTSGEFRYIPTRGIKCEDYNVRLGMNCRQDAKWRIFGKLLCKKHSIERLLNCLKNINDA